MKKVITLSENKFHSDCQKLFYLTKDCNPLLIIAVATGGIYVVEKMGLENFQTINSSRNYKSTKSKQIVKKIIKMMPNLVNNFLRNIEYKIQLSKLDNKDRKVEIQNDTLRKLEILPKNSTILIVDDAVDSGNSLLQIIQRIKSINNSINIKTAAIVVTDKNKTQYLPDFYLYENVLVRFPWALDA